MTACFNDVKVNNLPDLLQNFPIQGASYGVKCSRIYQKLATLTRLTWLPSSKCAVTNLTLSCCYHRWLGEANVITYPETDSGESFWGNMGIIRTVNPPRSNRETPPVSKTESSSPAWKISLSYSHIVGSMVYKRFRQHTLNLIFPGISTSNKWILRYRTTNWPIVRHSRRAHCISLISPWGL